MNQKESLIMLNRWQAGESVGLANLDFNNLDLTGTSLPKGWSFEDDTLYDNYGHAVTIVSRAATKLHVVQHKPGRDVHRYI